MLQTCNENQCHDFQELWTIAHHLYDRIFHEISEHIAAIPVNGIKIVHQIMHSLSDRIGSNVWNRKNLTPLGWGDFGIEVDIWKRRHSGRGIFWKGAGWDRMEDLARILKGRTLGWKILKAGILEGRILGGEHFAGVGHSEKGWFGRRAL